MIYTEEQYQLFKANTFNKKLLAIDLGLKRTGLAICDSLWIASKPLTIIKANNWREMLKKINSHYLEQNCFGIGDGHTVSYE